MIAWFIPQDSSREFGSLKYAADDIINSEPAVPESLRNRTFGGHEKIDENDRFWTFQLLTLDDYFSEHSSLRRVFVLGCVRTPRGGMQPIDPLTDSMPDNGRYRLLVEAVTD